MLKQNISQKHKNCTVAFFTKTNCAVFWLRSNCALCEMFFFKQHRSYLHYCVYKFVILFCTKHTSNASSFSFPVCTTTKTPWWPLMRSNAFCFTLRVPWTPPTALVSLSRGLMARHRTLRYFNATFSGVRFRKQ